MSLVHYSLPEDCQFSHAVRANGDHVLRIEDGDVMFVIAMHPQACARLKHTIVEDPFETLTSARSVGHGGRGEPGTIPGALSWGADETPGARAAFFNTFNDYQKQAHLQTIDDSRCACGEDLDGDHEGRCARCQTTEEQMAWDDAAAANQGPSAWERGA